MKASSSRKLSALYEVMRIRRVPVYVHWTTLVVSALILAATIRHPLATLVALLSYWSVLLIHECGHMYVAQRLGCRVTAIELYPIVGICRFETPWSRLDHCLIAWGGVAAQVLVALPIIVWAAVFGDPQTELGKIATGILAGYSVIIAMVNLLPVRSLDGS